MSQSGIEWTDWSLNPVKGKCPMACPYCYAREMYDRFRWNPQIRFVPEVFETLPEKPVRVFVGSTIELFGEWVEYRWLADIFWLVKAYPQHTFLFLTKLPEKLPKWSPFPENCQVGVTLTTKEQHLALFSSGFRYIEANIKYVSLEPLLENLYFHPKDIETLGIKGVIIGALTGRKSKIMELAKQYPDLTPMPWGGKWTLQPKIEWVEEIVKACDKAGTSVFLKDNLMPLFSGGYYDAKGHLTYLPMGKLRQEMPKNGRQD